VIRWTPVLGGELADEARACTLAIARELEGWEPPAALEPAKAIDLPHGQAGVALFLAYLARVTGDGAIGARASATLDRALDALATTDLDPCLHGGFTGIAWVQEHLRDDAEGAEPIDEVLLGLLGQDRWAGALDLTLGLVGYGIYLLERPRSPMIDAALDRVIHHLVAAAETAGEETWWRTPAWLVPARRRGRYPGGYVDVSLAHGMPGIVSFLAIAGERVGTAGRHLLPRALRWIWNRRLPAGVASRFPRWVAPGQAASPDQAPEPGRAAALDGDAGVAVALLHGARALGDPVWWERGCEVARHLARRDPASCEVVDASLGHGAAGIALVLTRLHHATGDAAIGEAARAWYRHLLAMRRPGEGIAGHLTREVAARGVVGRPPPGVHYGAAGIGLALLAGWSEVAPAWDRVLLTDLPPRS
jgi:lantibiotic biosynthesis protein